MLESRKITSRQFTILVALFTIGDSILVLPSITAFDAKQDAWIVAIISTVIGIMLMFLYESVGRLYPNLTFVQYSEKIFGTWIGRVISISFLFYVFLSAVALVSEIGNFVTIQMLVGTPVPAIHFVYLLVVLTAVRLGHVTIAKSAELFSPLLMIFLLGMFICLVPQVKLANVLPILEDGFKPIIRGSITFITIPFFQLLPIIMYFPFVKEPERIRKSLVIGTALGGFILFVLTLLSILVLGTSATARSLYPTYLLAQKINVGNFLQRLESSFAGIWFVTMFFKVSIFFHIFVLGSTQLVKMKSYRPLILPLGMILFTMSIYIAPNNAYFNLIIKKYWPFYDFTIGFALPCLLLGVVFIKKKFAKKSI